ncbi:MAG: SIR2 family protein [Chloroflexota bacterium]|nr:MAG: SIR2 family protein [Chloroflexota bacterium]
MEEKDWELLLDRISSGKCTPIIGNALSDGILPLRTDTAESWAHQYNYPLADSSDLARVSLYLAVAYDPFYPKEHLQKIIEAADPPDFSSLDQPHAILADLDLPIYITTAYDDFLFEALQQRGKEPVREICRWNSQLLKNQPSVLETGYRPSTIRPLVYHLHGHAETPGSMVLTEDDYLDFLVNISRPEYELPPTIQGALAGASLLLIGFRPFNWDFRVLFRGLVTVAESHLRRISVTVQVPQLPEGAAEGLLEKVQRYLGDYFGISDHRIRVYWGEPANFMTELHQRWSGLEVQAKTEKLAAGAAPIDLMSLLRNTSSSFSKEELHNIAFELRVDYENLPDAKDGFARELIVYLQRRRRLHELIEVLRRERPKVTW